MRRAIGSARRSDDDPRGRSMREARASAVGRGQARVSAYPSPPKAAAAHARRAGPRSTVLAIVADAPTRELFPKVIVRDHLLVTADLVEGLALAEEQSPDAAFVEIGI